MRRLRALPADTSGATLVEFALISPVLMLLLLGMFDMGYNYYVQSQLHGAVLRAARDSGIEGAEGRRAAIDDRVIEAVRDIVPHAKIEFGRTAYAKFADVEQPEDYTDINNNNVCDDGEPYEDANGNGQWDEDRGAAGMGGARDVILYAVTITYRRPFGISRFIGLPEDFSTTATTVLRNQPWAAQNIESRIGRCQ
jgi:Flp pilus assembly pilin Flp